MKKKLLLFCSILVLGAASMSGCGNKKAEGSAIPKMTDKDEASLKEKKYREGDNGVALVASNDKYELSIDKNAMLVQVSEKATGHIWSSAMDVTKVGLDPNAVSPAKLKRYESPLQVTYLNSKKDSAAAISAYLGEFKTSGIETYTISENSKEVGVRAEYALDSYGKDEKLNIKIKVDYILDEDGFKVRIPKDGITEDGDFVITALNVLPYFAAASNSSDGYFFYPDGSGAIMEFKDTSHHGEQDVSYRIYGNLQKYKNAKDQWAEDESETFMPLYGANIDNNSFAAIVDKGEETASVKVSPSKSDMEPVNYLSCEFEFRKAFDDKRFEVSDSKKQVLMYDDELNNVERSITYHLFASGTNTKYADFAVCYRNYLLANGVKAKKNSDNIPLSLDVFMGIKEDGMIFDKFNTVTSFSQLEDMIEGLKKDGVDSVEVQVKGWTKNGYFTDPVQFPVNSKVGGKKGLTNLTEKYKKDDNIKISLETNLIEAKEKAKGYNMSTDTITLGNFSVYSDFKKKMFLMSPNVSNANLDKFIKDAKRYAIDGISFYSLGQYILYNYNTKNKLTTSQCKLIWEDMLKKTDDKYESVIVQGGNQYALFSADKLTDIPYEDCGYRITTQSVPVYQIALHGLVEFTGKAGNLSSNLTEETLKWAEYGYMPYFELTHDGSEELMHTDYNNLFSSTFSTWKEEAVKIYKDFNENLKDVWHAYITNHEEIAAGVYKVTYDNGTIVYVNYNKTEVSVEDNTIVGAESYIVKK